MYQSYNVKIIPEIREDGIIEGIEISKDTDIFIGISSDQTKPYSFVVKITQGELETENNHPILRIDNNLVGPLQEGDRVTLFPIKPPEAKTLTLYIEDIIGIPGGDWGDILKESLNNKILDVGQEVYVVYPSLIEPLLLQAIVHTAIPQPPVIYTESTKVFVEKKNSEELRQELENAYQYRVKRAQEYVERHNKNLLLIFSQVKSGLLPQTTKQFEFTANAETAAKILKTLFPPENLIIKHEEYIDQDFIASYAWIDKTKKQQQMFIETRIYGKTNSGKIFLTIYSPENPEIKAMEIEQALKEAIKGIQTKPVILPTQCQGCGADLPIQNADENGLIQCPICQSWNQLPISFTIK